MLNELECASEAEPKSDALKRLEKAARAERLPHLLLFHGGSILERRATALRMALILNCLALADKRPCQVCSSCRQILSGNHPDVLIVEPLKTSFGIEQVIRWQEKVYRKHYEGHYKIFILEGTDKLTPAAANALLKVIEEPPPKTLIILSAQNAETLLPTIQSRAQAVYFPMPDEERWLKSREIGSDTTEAREAYRLSGGNPDLAAEIMKKGIDKVKGWLLVFRQAVEEKDFLRLFALFPLEKEEALIFLQCLANGRQGTGNIDPLEMIAVGKAIDQIQMQVNPRLTIEVLTLKLFR